MKDGIVKQRVQPAALTEAALSCKWDPMPVSHFCLQLFRIRHRLPSEREIVCLGVRPSFRYMFGIRLSRHTPLLSS